MEKGNPLRIALFVLEKQSYFGLFFIPHAVFWMHSQYTRMPNH